MRNYVNKASLMLLIVCILSACAAKKSLPVRYDGSIQLTTANYILLNGIYQNMCSSGDRLWYHLDPSYNKLFKLYDYKFIDACTVKIQCVDRHTFSASLISGEKVVKNVTLTGDISNYGFLLMRG